MGVSMLNRRALWILVGCVGATLPAGAEMQTQAVPESLAQCAQEQNDAARLACFDRELARLTVVVEAKPADLKKHPKQLEEDFGARGTVLARKEAKEADKLPRLEALVARITSLKQQGYGQYTVELDNGQVWEQKQPVKSFSLKQGERVEISRKSLGSYWLQNESGRGTRVTRIR